MADKKPSTTVEALPASLIADAKTQVKLFLDSAKTLVDGLLSGEGTNLPVVAEDAKVAGLAYLDAHLTGFTKNILDAGLSMGGAAAIEGLIKDASTAGVAQLLNLSHMIDAHLDALGA